jgi:hypothetical protein
LNQQRARAPSLDFKEYRSSGVHESVCRYLVGDALSGLADLPHPNPRARGSVVGLVEGVAQATQNIAQGFSGRLSDKLQKKKSLVLAGYLLSVANLLAST